MSKHWSIEVLDGPFSAETWYAAHGQAHVEAAVGSVGGRQRSTPAAHAELSCGDVACTQETGAADVTAAFSAFPEGSGIVVVDCGRTVGGQ